MNKSLSDLQNFGKKSTKKKGKGGAKKSTSNPNPEYKMSPEERSYLRWISEGTLKKSCVEFVGRIPSKKNQKINVTRGPRAGMSFPSKRYTGWHKEMMNQLHMNNLPEIIAEFGTFKDIAITLYFPDKRGDNTNKTESVMDFFVDLYKNEESQWYQNQLLSDDCWVQTGSMLLVPEYRLHVGGFKIEPLEEHIKNKYQHLFKNSLHTE